MALEIICEKSAKSTVSEWATISNAKERPVSISDEPTFHDCLSLLEHSSVLTLFLNITNLIYIIQAEGSLANAVRE